MRSQLKVLSLLTMLIIVSACVAVNQKKADPNEIATVNINLAQNYYAKGRFDVSEEKLLKALDAEPHNTVANSMLALVYSQQGKIPEAQEQFEKALDLVWGNSVEFAEINNNFAIFLCQNGDWREAESHFNDAVGVSAYKTRDAALENAGLCALKHEDYDKAALYFQKALSENKNMLRSILGLAKVKAQELDWRGVKSQIASFHLKSEPVEESLYLATLAERNLNNKTSEMTFFEQLNTLFPGSDYIRKLNER